MPGIALRARYKPSGRVALPKFFPLFGATLVIAALLAGVMHWLYARGWYFVIFVPALGALLLAAAATGAVRLGRCRSPSSGLKPRTASGKRRFACARPAGWRSPITAPSAVITIDAALLRASGMLPNEAVLVADSENGNRFETYVIVGEAGSGVIGINGAAARLSPWEIASSL